ncbi:hypothetical protein PaG_03840 [Moesziomyces aphidis]|uniref:Uncharacterized protein n=1 Tax=Moesziomyces aphidis TaxID=84754 RepID=W3VJS5_MOEAP|nr:hypothetical protein PaG_03840 [Moesziomyces aphidis]
MPPKRTNTSALSDASSSTIPKRPRGRPRKDADVSLSSTVGGPTPARRSAAASSSSSSRRQAQDSGDVSLASTLAPSTPAQPKKRGRPAKSSLTTPAMRAFTSADTSAASSAGPKKRGRPPKPKSILSARDDRTLTSPDNSVSFSDDPAHRALLRGLANQRAVRDADTTAGSSVAPPRKRGRPPKSAGTATSDTSIDMSAAATPNAPARKRGRPPKSASAAVDASVSMPTDATPEAPARKRGRPPKSVSTAPNNSVSTSTPAAKRRGRPSGSSSAKKDARTAAPDALRRSRPVEDSAESDVSLVDGGSDEASEADDAEQSDADVMSSDGEAGAAAPRRLKSKKRKDWPSERERLRKWRRLSVQERECITSEGGLIWRTAIPLLNSMPKNIRSMVADSLTRALNRIDGKLETGLVPPLARIPLGSATNTSRRDLPSSMLAWRLEEEGSLLRAEAGDTPEARSIDTMSLGMNAEITELEQMLLPEAEQIVGLSKTLEHQTQQLEQSQADIARLKRERKLIKSQGTSDYPPNLEAHDLLSASAQKPELDATLGSYFRLGRQS